MVDTADFARAPTRAALGIPADALLIGWTGRLDAWERVEDFLAAAVLVRAEEPRARFLVIGGSDALASGYAAMLRARATALGLDGALSFLGERPDLPALLSSLDVFVRLSTGEGMPRAIIEAGAAGLATIAAPDGDGARRIVDGVDGLLVPSRDPSAAVAAILRLARDPALRRRLGAALRAAVLARHDAAVVVPRWRALFEEVLAERPAAPRPSLFRSFVQGGWECSTHRQGAGRRVDVIASIGHDRHAAGDYRQLADLGLVTQRDGLRWHAIEHAPGWYDFTGWNRMLAGAERAGAQVIWDLMHYGWPDGLDIWSPAFVDRFAAFARAAARHYRDATDAVPFWCPVNEISFFAWAGGDVAHFNPLATGRGFELKVQLARAAIVAMHELRAVDPRARFVHCEPMIAVQHDPALGFPRARAEAKHDSQYQAAELISGRIWPQIGGEPGFLDIIGANYYPHNQSVYGGVGIIGPGHPLHRAPSDLLCELYARFGRPVLISETGTEDEARAGWFRMIAAEVNRARARGVPVEGICLYPVANHIGWDDDRLCRNGLLGHEVRDGARTVDPALLAEIRAGAPREIVAALGRGR
jgi:hypothetical protein